MPLMLKEYVTRLDTDQQKAVLADPTPLLVMAGAGSGKTALLTSRVAHMIDTGVASPEKILVSAFTRVAANEMQERVQSLTDCSNLVVGTFHSIMFKFLNDYRAASGRKPYGVCKEGPKKIFFQGILDKPSKNYPQGLNLEADLGNVMAIIGRWKNSCIVADGPEVRQTADEAPRNTDEYAAAKAYPLYEEWLASQNLIDFDDMLLKTWVLLTVDPNALSEARARWDAFFVDECQDTNVVQFKLLELIAPPTSQPNITLVGDLRQALYSFRGAAPELVTWFEERWKAQRIDLINNYRSVHEIVSAANQLAGNMGMKDQKSTRGTGNSPVVQEFNDVYDQALGIVEDVADLREQGMKGGDIAILTRTNAQSAPIESAFVKAGLPYWSSGGGFFDLMEVGDLIAYLRLANERTNVDLLERIINRPTRYLGKAFAHAVAEKAAAQFDGDLVKALRFTDSYPGKKLWKKQREAAIALADLLEGMSEKDDEEPIRPTGALYRVLNSTSYMEWLKKTTGLGEDADSSRQENVDALLVAAGEHYSIRDFLKFVDESKRLQMESDDATQILTTHRSKGGQWDVVWVSNMHDDSFPHKAAKLEGNLLPERRVAYVAFTRAKNQLKIAVPATDDKGNSVAPSRYISDAGLEITESVDSPLVLQSP